MGQTLGSQSNVQASERQVVQQDTYEAEIAETTWVDLEHGSGSMQLQEVQPLKLLRSMEDHGVQALLGGGKQDDVDMAEMVESGGLSGFIDETVLPNVLQPAAYWSSPVSLLGYVDDDTASQLRNQHDFDAMDDDTVAATIGQHVDQPVFDLAALHPEDLMLVITTMSGQSQEELQDQMDEQFQ